MPQLTSALCFLVAVLGYRKYKFILNPITSMFAFWGIILPFTNLGLYDVTNPDYRVYVIIVIGLTSYLAGVLVSAKNIRFKIGNIHSTTIKHNIDYVIRYRLMYVLCAIALIYYISQFLIVFRLLLSGNTYAYVRQLNTMAEENPLYSSYAKYLVKVFIAIPTTYVAIAILPIDLFMGKKNKILIIESILLLALFVLTTGGRSVILFVLIYFAFVFLLYAKKYKHIELKSIKRYKKIVIVAAVAAILFLHTMTTARKGADVDLLRQFFVYYVAPIRHFDHYIDVVNDSGVYGFGMSSFYGLLYPILFILKTIGIFSTYPTFVTNIHYMSFEMMERGTNIGGGMYMNAFVTIFYQPYLDGRYLGVVICLFIFGVMCGRTFVNAYYKESLRSLLLYILLLQKIFSSVVRFYFTQQAQSLAFVLAFFTIAAIKHVPDKVNKMENGSNGISYYSNLQ